ncbi:MAG: DUF3369 domain-containing protein, partial [Rhodospirillales bacterium]|nr:DUF3369 domain-containing protein [Rhodospirillales bacterium]
MTTPPQIGAEEIVFADENDSAASPSTQPAWKVIIVDNDESIHAVTKIALSDFEFDGRGLEFIDADDGREAMDAVHEHPDAAVMLLDVVMETEHAGLDVARYVREDAENKAIRIILRTGQPGQAPEKDVVTRFDINDYKEKTELTARKLFTLMYSSLRSFRDIMALERNKRGLERVIESSKNIFELRNMHHFTKGVLTRLTSVLHLDENAAYFQADGLAASHEDNRLNIIAATGQFKDAVGKNADDILGDNELMEIRAAIEKGVNQYSGNRFTGFFRSSNGHENVIFLSGLKPLSTLDRTLIELLAKNIGIAYENIELHQDVGESQREIVYMLGEAVETRSQETGNHVKRVAEISKLLALEYGLDEDEAEFIRFSSPLHDVGKIAIPDAILNKPGKHTPEETAIMQT